VPFGEVGCADKRTGIVMHCGIVYVLGLKHKTLLCIDLHGGILFTVMYNQCDRKWCVPCITYEKYFSCSTQKVTNASNL